MAETSWATARETAAGLVGVGAFEEVDVGSSRGRTLAQDVQARIPLPSFPTAAMDGWVVRGQGPWRIVGTIDAGSPSEMELQPGEAMRIATGAVVPGEDVVVIPWEQTQVRDGLVDGEIPAKLHIRPVGEECQVGDVLARRGDVVNPALLGSLAAAGIDEVQVVVPPRIAVLVLGDEVVTAGTPQAGRIRDALGVQLPGWIEALGGRTTQVLPVPDDLAALVDALGTAVEESDIVVCTGGTSRGHRDFLRAAIVDTSGALLVDGVAVRPGHPMMLATIGGHPVVGLPGNPLSALVALVTFLAPLMDSWLGRPGESLPRVQMAQGIGPAKAELTRLLVGRRELGGFEQVDFVSSAMLRGIAHADGWAVVPPEGVERGEVVEWIPVPWSRCVSVDS